MKNPAIPEDERQMIQALKHGKTIVFKIPTRGGTGHKHVYEWAKAHNRFVRIDRQPWRNPFTVGKDGTRLDVLFKHAFWAGLYHAELSKHLPSIQGMALGCTCQCAPAWCHGGTLIQILNERKPRDRKGVRHG